MILIVDTKTKKLKAYPTLRWACSVEKWMSYSYLSKLKLSDKCLEYKGYWLYRTNHTTH